MTDNDIIKALEKMAFLEGRRGEVRKETVLNRAAEIIICLRANLDTYCKRCWKLEEENRRLSKSGFNDFDEVRKRAIKEFAKRLKSEMKEFEDTYSYNEAYDDGFDDCLEAVGDVIDDLVKKW